MAELIIDFINNCDLYRINYSILKDMIKEIALQPPHPWLISEETKDIIIKYDRTQLKKNLNKARTYNNGKLIPQSITFEIIHHASSLLLAKYHCFLGCYDLSSFQILNNVIKEIIKPNNWDLNISQFKINNIIEDISLSKISINDFNNTLNQINNLIKEQKINTQKFNDLSIKYGEQILDIDNCETKESISCFLNSNWSKFSKEEITKFIKLILYSIYPVKIFNINYKKEYFWVNYLRIKSESYPNIKNRIFVIYSDDSSFNDIQILNKLNRTNEKATCNLVMIISENKKNALKIKNDVDKFFCQKKMSSDYLLIYLDKAIRYWYISPAFCNVASLTALVTVNTSPQI